MAWAASLACSLEPASANETIWDHNGSKITWRSDGNARSAIYLEPRAGLATAGVQPGTLLFKGERRGNTLSGTAYVFKKGCSPAAYPVSATVASEREFVLEGSAPVFESGGCGIARYDAGNGNAALRFTFIPPGGNAAPAVADNAPLFVPAQTGDVRRANNDSTEFVTKEITLAADGLEPITINVELPSHYTLEASSGSVDIRPANDFERLGWLSLDELPEWMEAKDYCKDEVNVSTGPGWARCSDKLSPKNVSIYMEMPGGRRITLYHVNVEIGDVPGADRALTRLIRSFIDGTADLRRVALAERRLREDREERNKERQRQAAAPPPRDPNSITFKIRSNYRYKAQVAFYSEDGQRAWPGNGQAYSLNDSEIHTFNLACRPGEKICYGAWATGNEREYWGVGLRNQHGCTSCCARCGGGTFGYNLTDTDGATSSNSFNANDLLDGLAAGMNGYAAGLSAGNRNSGGGAARPVPAPRQRASGNDRRIESDVTRSR